MAMTDSHRKSSATIVNLAQSLRVELAPDVDVRLVTPGFVRTDLTAKNNFEMPFLMEPEEAARRILRGLHGPSFEIAFPRRLIWPLRLLAWSAHVVLVLRPESVLGASFRREVVLELDEQQGGLARVHELSFPGREGPSSPTVRAAGAKLDPAATSNCPLTTSA